MTFDAWAGSVEQQQPQHSHFGSQLQLAKSGRTGAGDGGRGDRPQLCHNQCGQVRRERRRTCCKLCRSYDGPDTEACMAPVLSSSSEDGSQVSEEVPVPEETHDEPVHHVKCEDPPPPPPDAMGATADKAASEAKVFSRLKEAETISISAIPKTASEYRGWELHNWKIIAGSSASCENCMRWLMEMKKEDVTFESLRNSGPDFLNLDIKTSAGSP